MRSNEIIQYANPAALTLFGANRMDELVGHPYLQLVHPDDRAGTIERVRKLRDEGLTAPPREHRILTLGGRTVDVESTAVLVQHRGEIQIFGIFRDITERKKALQEKTNLETQLRQAQKMEALGTLAGGIAHDFNNILGVIIGGAEMLELTDATRDSSRDTLANIMGASQRARELVKQILAFSRHTRQERILLNLRSIVKETVDFMRASLPSTIQLQHYIESASGAIVADPTQMQQVLMNLCTNAAHAMEREGGILQIRMADVELGASDVRFGEDLKPGRYVRVTVTDTGHGIDPAVIQRIFEPYFTTKEKGKGTGLGLAVVHGIVAAHNGAITVSSEPGQGTTFEVFLPCAEGYAKEAGRQDPEPLPTGTGRILLVDDEAALLETDRQILGLLGYTVEATTSPLEALAAFPRRPQRL